MQIVIHCTINRKCGHEKRDRLSDEVVKLLTALSYCGGGFSIGKHTHTC